MGYVIRMCRTNEVAKLTDFLASYWRTDHILTRDAELLHWQHRETGRLNFVVANHTKTDKFHAILGLISPTHYSTGQLSVGDDIWLVIWKAEGSLVEEKSLGIRLLDYVRKEFNPVSISAIGINSDVAKLYRILGFHVDVLGHYFIRNPDRTDFKIGHFPQSDGSRSAALQHSMQADFREVNDADFGLFEDTIDAMSPVKNFRYLRRRYVDHPRYKYKFYSVVEDETVIAMAVGRLAKVGNAACLRVVDFLGMQNMAHTIKQAVEKYLRESDLEYMDFIHYGAPRQDVLRMGFEENSESSFVPHLFEPFDPNQQSVRFAYTSPRPFYVFKGDSDLDRPNR
jgi:hypothetical protein